MAQRFTIDGSAELESRLERTCARLAHAIRSKVPHTRLQALVLGGGYGRGQGGVLITPDGDQPYNDLEFYLFLAGSRLLNVKRYGPPVDQLCESLSAEAGLHVEVKIDSLPRLRAGPVSMFSYDLVSGHRIVIGDENGFEGCEHHRDATAVPLSEATRLLWNRCSGLLLSKRLLALPEFGPDEADFVGRNLAKAWLAMGDAVLTVEGEYHWSCLERSERLGRLRPGDTPPHFEQLCRYHAAGVEFKLHPRRGGQSRQDLQAEYKRTSLLAESIWLWLERRRLSSSFDSVREYACSAAHKCPENRSWRNLLMNLRSLGWRSLLDESGWRYPRERLLNALPLLLWDQGYDQPSVRRRLQQALASPASDWDGLVSAYRQLWNSYG